MKKLILSTTMTFFCFIQANATQLTLSQETAYLEVDSKARTTWVLSKNGETNEALKKKTEFKSISTELWEIFNQPFTLSTYRIDDQSVLKTIDLGIGKPTIIKIESNESEKIIFSTYQLKKNNQYQIEDTQISSNKLWVIVRLAHQGTIDDFYYLIINTKTAAVAFERQFVGAGKKPKFISADVFYYIEKINGQEEVVYFNLNTLTKEVHPEIKTIDLGFRLTRVVTDSQDYFIDFSGRKFAGIDFWPSDALAYQDGVIWSTERDWNENEISKYSQRLIATKLSDKVETTTSATIVALNNEVIDETLIAQGYLILQTHWGIDRKLRIYKTTGESIYSINLPPNVNVSIDGWQELGKKLKIYLDGPGGSTDQILDISALSTEIIASKNLFELADMTLDIQTMMIPSFDGTLIPIQIIKKVDTDLKQPRPAFIQVYGGFESPGRLFDFYEAGLRKYIPFLKRGGMIVNPGIRGGDEFGPAWHATAMKKNKNKTFEDAAAVAKYLIDSKLSVKEQITLTGSSNGGFVSAATGLLFEKYFGLIIPHAGVHDMLGKTRIDPRFKGWTYEYLNENDAAELPFIAAQSPLEIAGLGKFNIPFLIMTGRKDSRVSAVHSYKLQSILEKTNQAPTHLYAINNAGHFEQSAMSSDVIAWRVWSVIWAFTLNH